MTEITYTQEDEKKEFPKGKDIYCPRCYFEDDEKVLRKDCKHNQKKGMFKKLKEFISEVVKEIKTQKEKCTCGKEICMGGAEVEIGGICHRLNDTCYTISKIDEIDEEIGRASCRERV